jgi:uncharacterized membrane protein YhfC
MSAIPSAVLTLHAAMLDVIRRQVDPNVLKMCLAVAADEAQQLGATVDNLNPATRHQLVLGLINGLKDVQLSGTITALRVQTLLTILGLIAVLDHRPALNDHLTNHPPHHQPPSRN